MLTQGISSQAFSNSTTCQAQSGAVTLQSSLNYSAANQIASGTWLDASNNTHTGTPSYDPAGEMTNDLLNEYLYNADGQVCAVQNGPGAYIGYLYDAEGHRVAKTTLWSLSCDPAAITTVISTYFIGPDGETMTEMTGTGEWVRTEVSAGGQYLATYKPDGIHYPILDWLGTKRMTFNPNLALAAGVEELCSSFPFGDQLNCHSPFDASPRHFTGKERDAESGLDYFGARYFGSNMGRFMSPDPSGLTYADLGNPQSLNLYSYVLNNPLINTDPTGETCQTNSTDGTVYDDLDGNGCSTVDEADKKQAPSATVNANGQRDLVQERDDSQQNQYVTNWLQTQAPQFPTQISPDAKLFIKTVADKTAGFPDICSLAVNGALGVGGNMVGGSFDIFSGNATVNASQRIGSIGPVSATFRGSSANGGTASGAVTLRDPISGIGGGIAVDDTGRPSVSASVQRGVVQGGVTARLGTLGDPNCHKKG